MEEKKKKELPPMKLPDHIDVVWVDCEEDVAKLEILLDEPLVGIDTEFTFAKMCLLQISGASTVFLVDMIRLKKSKTLEKMLIEVFGNEKSTIVGFSFLSDQKEFGRNLPHMRFMDHAANFIDIQSTFRQIKDLDHEPGLSKVVAAVLDKCLSKAQQRSKWG